jgi:hypothetical protein
MRQPTPMHTIGHEHHDPSPMGRASPLQSTPGAALPNGFAPVASPASGSLTRTHIDQALLRSPDHGTTLDLTHLGLADVGEEGAQDLVSIGREDVVDAESPIVRYEFYSRVRVLV